MSEISPESDVSRKKFSGENRQTYWKNIFDFKRLKVSKQKVFTEMIETDGVALCILYRRLKTDRPVRPSAAPVTKDADEQKADPGTQKLQDDDLVVDAAMHEDEKEADLATQEVQDNDFVVGADPGNTNNIIIAVPQRAEDGTDGNLRQKYMRLLGFSRARYYRESGIMNARKKIAAWNERMKEHLEAMSEVTSRRADIQALRKFMELRIAHWYALWKE